MSKIVIEHNAADLTRCSIGVTVSRVWSRNGIYVLLFAVELVRTREVVHFVDDVPAGLDEFSRAAQVGVSVHDVGVVQYEMLWFGWPGWGNRFGVTPLPDDDSPFEVFQGAVRLREGVPVDGGFVICPLFVGEDALSIRPRTLQRWRRRAGCPQLDRSWRLKQSRRIVELVQAGVLTQRLSSDTLADRNVRPRSCT